MLSACSSFFKGIIKKNSHTNPLVYLCGVDSKNLGFILDYIYQGEVQIYQEQLDPFLNIAQKLKIEGLISSNQEQPDEPDIKADHTEMEDSLNFSQPENMFIKPSPKRNFKKQDTPIAKSVGTFPISDMSEVDQKIEELAEKIDGVWTCKACGKTSQRRRDLGWHIETHLENLSFPCQQCDKTFRSSNTLNSHYSRFHR